MSHLVELAGTSLLLRSHADGALSWTADTDLARRFDSEDAARAFAEARISADVCVVKAPPLPSGHYHGLDR